MTYHQREITTELQQQDDSVHMHRTAYEHDPIEARRVALFRWTQAIYLIFGVLEALIGIRFLLRLFGANPQAPFTAFLYDITDPFVAPFVGVFNAPQFEGNVFEPHSLLAIAVYALLAWLLVRVLWLTMSDPGPVHRHTGETRTVHHRRGGPPVV